jgi:hypothetical protein
MKLRYLFIFLISIVVIFFFLQERAKKDNSVLPVFITIDTIAAKHTTNISVTAHSVWKPQPSEVEILKKDYSNIWAHLNNVYGTNDVNAGKEYYTEEWFEQICNHYEGPVVPIVTRTDIQHELHIHNWENDGLVCTGIDSNVILRYQYPPNKIKYTKANIAVILLLQGEHWRIDAIRIIDELHLCGK